MDHDTPRGLLHHLRPLARAVGAGLTDRELLERFVAHHDEAAFELLLWRHGGLVLGVCRRLLSDPQDAEDAFQATFFTFIRKAGSIARGQAVGAWLHRVAQRVALRARAERARRVGRQTLVLEEPPAPVEDPVWREVRAVLDEEVNRLPDRWRTVFVLCCLEGKTGEEAARELGCPPGTVSSRLTRARQRLRDRLTHRGLQPATLAVMPPWEALSTVPAPLVHSTFGAALRFAAGQAPGLTLSPKAVTLAQGVLRAMFLTRLKFTALLLLLAGLLSAGGALSSRVLLASPPEEVGQDQPDRKADSDKKPAPVAVSVIQPQLGGIDRRNVQSCVVQAASSVEVGAVVPGVLKELHADLGDHVKAGQLLAELDAPLLVLEVKQAKVAVEQARSQLTEAEARIVAAQAEVEAARAGVKQKSAEVDRAQAEQTSLRNQVARLKALHAAVPASALDEKEQKFEAAKALVAVAMAGVAGGRAEVLVKEGQLERAKAGMSLARAGIESARLSLEKAEHTRELTRIVSPCAGVITRQVGQVGQFLRPGEQGGAVPLVTIQQIQSVRVVAEVDSSLIPFTEVGGPVEVGVRALPGARFHGKIARIGFVADPKTGTMRVEIDLLNPGLRLRPGMSGQATLQLGKAPAGTVRIPTDSVIRQWDGLCAVYVVRDGKAHRTGVELGLALVGGSTEIVSGLKPTDRVVRDPSPLVGEVVEVEVRKK